MLAGCLWLAATGVAGAQVLPGPASIRGKVSDTQGRPLAGALVWVRAPEARHPDQFVLTDALGAFAIPGLGAGEYFVRVTKSAFRPTEVAAVDLPPGSRQVLTIVLQTAIDFVTQGVRRGSLEDTKAVLRSSQSTRPILRHGGSDGATRGDEALAVQMGPEASGHFQVYSSSMESSSGPSDAVGSQFAVTVPISPGARVRLEGQYTESDDQPRGVGATYEFSSGGRQHSSLGVNLRQGAWFSGPAGTAAEREVSVEYVEQFQWSDDLVLQYGATAGRTEGISDGIYLRPELGVAWAVRPWTTLRATISRQAPTDSRDPIRGREFFDRAVYIPEDLEHFSHFEVGLTQIISESFQLSAAVFRDEIGTQAFLIDAEDGSRAFLIVDGTGMPASGVRLVLDRELRGFDLSVGYTYASAFGFSPDVDSPEDLRSAASRQQFHILTGRVNRKIDLTQTEITAVYRWAPGHPLAPVDPYQLFAEYNDPTLSLTVAQDLPSVGLLPAKLQAVLDARNLFEPDFGSRRTVQAGYPRILKGGINFKF